MEKMIKLKSYKVVFFAALTAGLLLPFSGSVYAAGARDGFVTVDGTKFMLDSRPFHYTGTNNYYLGIDPYRTQAEVDEVFEDAKKMGLSVIRTWGFSDGYYTDGDPRLQTSPGVYNESLFEKLDYAVSKAGETGIKLIVPFVNNWDDYGGMNQYVDWSGTASSHDDFYTDTACKTNYKNHISTLLNRTNTITGTQYKNDPAIMAWELANEPRCTSDTSGDTLDDWVAEMGDYVKDLDANHLLTTGMEGFYDGGSGWRYNGSQGTDFVRNHDHDDIDYATYHIYSDYWGLNYNNSMAWVQEHTDDAHTTLGKPVVLGEYGKYRDGDGVSTTTRDNFYEGFLDKMYDNEAAGSNFWILYHDTYPDYDKFGVYYPSDESTVSVLMDGVADSMYLSAVSKSTVSLTQGNIEYFTPPAGWSGELTYSKDTDAEGFIGEIELLGLLPEHDYLLSFEGVAENIPMSSAELASYGIYYNDGGRLTTGGGVWPESASGDYGEYAGMEVAYCDFKLIETDDSGNYNGRFFFNALGEMDPGWYYTRFIVKDARSWTIHDYTGTWHNEVLYSDNVDFDPPQPVPEPATCLLMLGGLAGLAGDSLRRRRLSRR